MDWKRVTADRIRSGKYSVVKESVFEEVWYMAEYAGELLTVAYAADVAKSKCERHAAEVAQ